MTNPKLSPLRPHPSKKKKKKGLDWEYSILYASLLQEVPQDLLHFGNSDTVNSQDAQKSAAPRFRDFVFSHAFLCVLLSGSAEDGKALTLRSDSLALHLSYLQPLAALQMVKKQKAAVSGGPG